LVSGNLTNGFSLAFTELSFVYGYSYLSLPNLVLQAPYAKGNFMN